MSLRAALDDAPVDDCPHRRNVGGWTSLGGKLTSAPAAARDGSGLHVYARGSDGTIASRSLVGGAWSAWASHGDGIGAIPTGARPAIYRLSAGDIVFRDYDYPAADFRRAGWRCG